jgi:signal transduction histidine kinase
MSEKQDLVVLPLKHASDEALRERVKELRLIYSLSELAQDPAITVERFLTAVAAILSAGWRYPDDACAAVTLARQVFASNNYRETPWQQRSPISVDGSAVGEVVVGYLSSHPATDDGPFAAEERSLLAEIALRIGRFVERARTQEALRHNEARYRGLFEHAPIAIFEQDFSVVKQRIDQLRREGVRDFRAFFDTHPAVVTECIQQVRFLAWSRASLTMYGARDEDELQVGLECLVPVGARRLFVDELVWIAQGRTAFEWEGINCKLDGEPFNIRLHWAAEPGYEESLARVLVTIEDITEVKRLQQAMIRSERLAAMGRITAVLAHEVQNPLQAIHTNLELLSSALLEPDEHEECLAICLSEVERLREMTRNVLSLSSVQPQALRTVSIKDVWRKAQHLLGEQMRSAGVDVVVDLPEYLPSVHGSVEQLGQVLINLALNAIDSMPNGGQMRIAGQAREGCLEITFANDGPPIPPEHLARLFDPFFTTKPSGAGLGLFVSHGIVQQHGGDLSVANLPEDQGVCFTMSLPAAAEQESPSEAPAGAAQDVQP